METVSRRSFVAMAAAPALLAAQSGQGRSPNNKVVLGLIGAGGRGSTFGANFAVVENTEFKYVCEVNDQRGAQSSRKWRHPRRLRPERVVDMRRVFDDKDVDGVVVATPEHWHALATVWACQAGKDVYVEKSPSLSVWEGRKMIEASRKYKRIVQVGFENRSGPYSATARDYIKSGKLGKIRLVKVYNLLPAAAARGKRIRLRRFRRASTGTCFRVRRRNGRSRSRGCTVLGKLLGLQRRRTLRRCQPPTRPGAHGAWRSASSEIGLLHGRAIRLRRPPRNARPPGNHL